MIHIDLPESVLLTTGQSQEDFVKEAKFLLAGRAGVPVADLDEEELSRELAHG